MTDPKWFTDLKRRVRSARMAHEVLRRDPASHPHGLSAPLIVSLTSYPERYATLHLTLRAVIRQTVKADRIILTLTEGDESKLPNEILGMQKDGLVIRTYRNNIKSYTKLVPVLREHPEAFVATCDDDVYYQKDWLRSLVDCARQHPGRIISHRSHRVLHGEDGRLLSYEAWDKNIGEAAEGPDIFATGVSGVLYPPNALDPMVFDEERFMRLCPTADDLWFYWMARRHGTTVRHIGPKTRIVEWPGCDLSGLALTNRGVPHDNDNDRAIRALTSELGLPFLPADA
ncbi:glycosyltransferase family 2 protein [Pseudohoeflea suaedae]|uniref:Glycosyltransferase family 2 protein n=1 Tax=Pseudohoeflea suaedae TaxID=877384 RepID=A0A4R5PPB9_9HYPH|nr:glycosyltransferase family A protein [Pseudohoeflea suaedae]TDH38934.1 glycosyltransferase family 2 protein [Pseudohoeflea suaedae]